MTLGNVIHHIDEIEDSRWKFSKREEEISQRIEGLAFKGELLKNNLFLSFPISMKNPKTKISRSMTNEEVNEYIDNDTISEKDGWVIDNWLTCRFDLDHDYIKIYETPFVSFKIEPKRNYERAALRTKEIVEKANEPLIFEIYLDGYKYQDSWLRLKKAVLWMRANPNYDTQLMKRITIDRALYFNEFNKNLIDDIYEYTGPTRKMKIPENFKTVKVDRLATEVFRGIDYETPFYNRNTTKKFSSRSELLDYYWSSIKWINENLNLAVTHVWKIEKSNEWLMDTMIDHTEWKIVDSNNKKMRDAYIFRCSKVKGYPLVEAIVIEDGAVWKLQNYDDEVDETYYYEKISDGR